MMKPGKYIPVFFLICAVMFGFSCVVERNGGRGLIEVDNYFTIQVTRNRGVEVIPPEFVDSEVDYPGITAERIAENINVTPGWLSLDGRRVTFYVDNDSFLFSYPNVWLVIKEVDSQVKLLSRPDARNLRKEGVFVLGSLGPQGRLTVQLEFDTAFLVNSYYFEFDILSISPRLIFTANISDPRQDNLYSVETDGGDLYQVTEAYRRDVNAVWSPGNERIAYEGFEPNGTFQIYTVHPDGSHMRKVTSVVNFSAFNPAFSPDGKHIVYTCVGRTPGSEYDICLNSIKGGEEKVIALGQGWYQDQAFWSNWSPDGTKITYVVRHPVSYNRFYIMSLEIDPVTLDVPGPPVQVNKLYDGTTVADSTYLCYFDSEMRWSPDSTHGVLIGRIRDKSSGVWVTTHRGVMILDMKGMLENGPKVYPGPFVTLLNNYQFYLEEISSPSFYTQGGYVTFRHGFLGRNDTIANVMLLPNYTPISLLEFVILELSSTVIRTPNWPPPLLPEFYE